MDRSPLRSGKESVKTRRKARPTLRRTRSRRLPRRSPRPDPALRVSAAVLTNERDEILLCQRRPGGRFGLKWEFPGGKVEPGETARSALRRELEEELGIQCRPESRLLRTRHHYPDGPEVILEFFRVRSYRGTLANRCFEDVRWVRPKDLERFDILEADASLVRLLGGHSR